MTSLMLPGNMHPSRQSGFFRHGDTIRQPFWRFPNIRVKIWIRNTVIYRGIGGEITYTAPRHHQTPFALTSSPLRSVGHIHIYHASRVWPSFHASSLPLHIFSLNS